MTDPAISDPLSIFKERANRARQRLHQRYPHVKAKLEKLGLDLKDLRRHGTKMLSAAALAGAMMATAPHVSNTFKPPAEERPLAPSQINDQLKGAMTPLLAGFKVGKPLNPVVETDTAALISKITGVKVTANLDGQHLPTTYGYMGAEQHLPRYPGDTIKQHDEIQKAGITPGLGGWRYFAASRKAMTQEAYMREKYYVAVPVMYLPNWNKETKFLSNWYKYRKVLVVNTANGKSIIADIADAGPAGWTGKQFGGSPEVMAYLGLNVGKQKGAVIMMFVDDQGKTLSLGPVAPGQSVYLAEK